jgi:hypothetical protein
VISSRSLGPSTRVIVRVVDEELVGGLISERRGAMVSVTKASRTSSLSTTSTAPMYQQGNDFFIFT